MPLEIRRRPRAKADRLDIWLHIAADSLNAADRLTYRIDEVVEMLVTHPEAGPERTTLAPGLRAFPIESFVIYYRVETSYIDIVRILHAARDIQPEMFDDA
jgi:toxin ParE1/3/4